MSGWHFARFSPEWDAIVHKGKRQFREKSTGGTFEMFARSDRRQYRFVWRPDGALEEEIRHFDTRAVAGQLRAIFRDVINFDPALLAAEVIEIDDVGIEVKLNELVGLQLVLADVADLPKLSLTLQRGEL